MRVLIAEDDRIARKILKSALERMSYEVISTSDGREALDALRSDDAPQVAIIDWMMPEMHGPEVCRQVRELGKGHYTYMILLTSKDQKTDVVAGMAAGADDYLVKPFDSDELHSRIAAGERIINLETQLAGKVTELEDALRQVKQLQGLLPICMHCKSIRDDENNWHNIETYIQQKSEANFTHSLCKKCLKEHYPEFAGSSKK